MQRRRKYAQIAESVSLAAKILTEHGFQAISATLSAGTEKRLAEKAGHTEIIEAKNSRKQTARQQKVKELKRKNFQT